MLVYLKFSTNINIFRDYILPVQGPWLSCSFPTFRQHRGHCRLFSACFSGPLPGVPLSSSLCTPLPRPEKNGATTGIDTVCTYYPDRVGAKLDREQLYWELSHGTCGVTKLGSFTLDKESLYVNGECPFCNYKLKLRISPQSGCGLSSWPQDPSCVWSSARAISLGYSRTPRTLQFANSSFPLASLHFMEVIFTLV